MRPPQSGTAAQLCLRRGGSSGSDVVETLSSQAGAVRKRLNRFTGELDELLGQLRALRNGAVERSADQLALQLEELGRRLDVGEGLHSGRSLFDALTAVGQDVLTDGAGAGGGNTAGLGNRFDVRLGDLGQLFGGLLRLADDFLTALAGIGEDGLEPIGARQGVEREQLGEIVTTASSIFPALVTLVETSSALRTGLARRVLRALRAAALTCFGAAAAFFA